MGHKCFYGCMGVWMYECMNVWMYGCMVTGTGTGKLLLSTTVDERNIAPASGYLHLIPLGTPAFNVE